MQVRLSNLYPMANHRRAPFPSSRHALSKVPEVTVYFWVIKVLTTGMGEAASDFLAHSIGPVLAVVVGLSGFLGSLRLQFRADRYSAGVYWFAIAMISVFGTMAADGVHLVGVPYVASTALFVVVLGAVFVKWYRSEGTLSIHSIYTKRREQFYWAVVLGTFALGTAAGDMTAGTLQLGYFWSGVLFAVLIAIPAVGYRFFGWNPVVAFWASYVVTRPLGASFADWMAVPARRGGLDWGTGTVTAVVSVAIIAFVGYLALTRRDIEPDDQDDDWPATEEYDPVG